MRGSWTSFGRRWSLAALGLAWLLALGPAPAQAQFFGYWGSRASRAALPAPVIYRRLRERGFRLFNGLQRNGGVYLADVIDRSGRRSRLVVDAYSGAILQSFAYGPPRPERFVPGGPRGYRAGPVYASRYPPAYETLPVPPRAIPAPVFRRRPVAKAEHPPRKLARREVRPVKPKAKITPAIRHASLSPAPNKVVPSASSAKAVQPTVKPSVQPVTKAPRTVAQSAPGITPPAPHIVKAKKAAKRINKAGYANGVPINPLD